MVEPQHAAHLAMALDAHFRRCREQGVPVPDGLRECHRWAVVVREGLSSPAPLPAPDDAGVVLLYTLPQVAEQLGCSLSSVKRLIEDGALPVVRPLGARRVRRTDLEAFVASLPPGGHFRDRLEVKEGA